MLTLVCAYNDQSMLENILKKSLKKQKNVEYNLIALNAEELGFSSASETLNYSEKLVPKDSEFIIFLHQDIFFENEYTLYEIEKYCRKKDFGIAGVAGILKNTSGLHTISNIKHGKEKSSAAEINDFSAIVEAESLDECLLIVKYEMFKNYKFHDLGKTWHLYGADYCTLMKSINKKVIVIPISLWHLSDGKSLNYNYFDSLLNLAKIYRDRYKKIYTMFGWWPTNPIILRIKIIYRKFMFKKGGKK